MEAIIDFIHEPESVLTALLYVLAFFTVYSLIAPYMVGNKYHARMKYVSSERDVMREARLKELGSKSSLRNSEAKSYMAQVVDNFKLEKALGTEDLAIKLKMAGLRGNAPRITFLFFRFVMPPILFIGALLYLFYVEDFGKPPNVLFLIAAGFGVLGFYAPNIFVQNMIAKRQESITKAFPDSLDLLLICVQSGMSVEAAFGKVSGEIGKQSIELAEELSLTTAELSYLPDRNQAYDNLAVRTGLKPIKSVTTSLAQAEKYGTPLGQALRVLAQESREERMATAEKKAASLPPKLTVPMIVFFLPVLFIVIMGPAAMKVSAMM